MNRQDFKKIMNPMEWLKTIYGAFGVRHPVLSLIIVMMIGAIALGGLWKLGAYQYQKDMDKAPAAIAQPPNSTYGPQSPIMPNNSGVVNITGESKGTESAPNKKGTNEDAGKTKTDKSP